MDGIGGAMRCWLVIAAPSRACWHSKEGGSMNKLLGILLAVVGGFALGGIALYRQEPINSLWIVVASVCVYLLGYRFYAAWIAAKIYLVDPTRATPAERLNNGRDFVPTPK